jgi:hypothetical protein
MQNYINSSRKASSLLILAVTASFGWGTTGSAQAAPPVDKAVGKIENAIKQIDKGNRVAILKRNDFKLKALETSYPEQAKSLAEQYKETAAIISGQGGDAAPLLAAAAYFEGDAEDVRNGRAKGIAGPPDHAHVKDKKDKHGPAE